MAEHVNKSVSLFLRWLRMSISLFPFFKPWLSMSISMFPFFKMAEHVISQYISRLVKNLECKHSSVFTE